MLCAGLTTLSKHFAPCAEIPSAVETVETVEALAPLQDSEDMDVTAAGVLVD